jgi:hypothetical protein
VNGDFRGANACGLPRHKKSAAADSAGSGARESLLSGHGDRRRLIGKQVSSLWEKLSASILAAGNPFP